MERLGSNTAKNKIRNLGSVPDPITNCRVIMGRFVSLSASVILDNKIGIMPLSHRAVSQENILRFLTHRNP